MTTTEVLQSFLVRPTYAAEHAVWFGNFMGGDYASYACDDKLSDGKYTSREFGRYLRCEFISQQDTHMEVVTEFLRQQFLHLISVQLILVAIFFRILFEDTDDANHVLHQPHCSTINAWKDKTCNNLFQTRHEEKWGEQKSFKGWMRLHR